MPTGYTAAIKDGISFKEYATHCARAFGALIMMRDEAQDAPIPDEFTPSDHHVKALEIANKELVDLEAASESDLQDWADAKFRNDTEYFDRCSKEREELLGKYTAMLEQAKAYIPPTPDHEGYAEFLVSQIEESIKWDCASDYPKPAVQLNGDQYKTQRLEKLTWDIDYHTKNHLDEVKRAAERTEWVKELKKSLA